MRYETLLELRRNEVLTNVDRYVPILSSGRKTTSFPFMKLPESVQKRVLDLLLTSKHPIQIDSDCYFPLIHKHLLEPPFMEMVTGANDSYTVSTPLDDLERAVSEMYRAFAPNQSTFHNQLTRSYGRDEILKSRIPTHDRLTLSLLQVSHSMHDLAASTLYGKNVFHFPSSDTAWLQLEAFLATIGKSNVARLRSLRIHAPLWETGVNKDFVKGAVLDLILSSMKTPPITPPPKVKARDRLRSAIKTSVDLLHHAGTLKRLAIDLSLEHMGVFEWDSSYSNSRRLMTLSAARLHITRKEQGVAILKAASERLPTQPVVTLYHSSTVTPPIARAFRFKLTGVIKEAAQYGWKVDQYLRGPSYKDRGVE